MTEPTKQDQLNSKLSAIRSKVQSLQSDAQLATIFDDIEDLDNRVNTLDDRLCALRQAGYVFGKGMEKSGANYAQRWKTLEPQLRKQVEQQAPTLQMELSMMTAQMGQINANAQNPAVGLPMAERFEHSLNAFESKVRAARSTIQGSYDSFKNDINLLDQKIEQMDWMLKQLAAASFKLLASEGCVMAVEARYARDDRMDKDDPRGVLYLSDQRLLFEQKEEVATKKFLFVTTDRELVQKLLLDVPVALIEKVEATKKGLFKNEDHITLTFKSGAPVRSAWFHLDGQDCAQWQALIGQACTHDFDDDRAVSLSAEVVEKVRQAPGKCPNCGAPVQQQVLRGMDTMTCQYCQYVMRL